MSLGAADRPSDSLARDKTAHNKYVRESFDNGKSEDDLSEKHTRVETTS